MDDQGQPVVVAYPTPGVAAETANKDSRPDVLSPNQRAGESCATGDIESPSEGFEAMRRGSINFLRKDYRFGLVGDLMLGCYWTKGKVQLQKTQR